MYTLTTQNKGEGRHPRCPLGHNFQRQHMTHSIRCRVTLILGIKWASVTPAVSPNRPAWRKFMHESFHYSRRVGHFILLESSPAHPSFIYTHQVGPCGLILYTTTSMMQPRLGLTPFPTAGITEIVHGLSSTNYTMESFVRAVIQSFPVLSLTALRSHMKLTYHIALYQAIFHAAGYPKAHTHYHRPESLSLPLVGHNVFMNCVHVTLSQPADRSTAPSCCSTYQLWTHDTVEVQCYGLQTRFIGHLAHSDRDSRTGKAVPHL